MHGCERYERDAHRPTLMQVPHRCRGGARRAVVALTLACLAALLVTAAALGQDGYMDEGYDQIDRRGLDQIDRINEALEQWGRRFVWVGAALSVVVLLRIVRPIQLFYSSRDRAVEKAVRGVNDLFKRIEKEAVVTSEDSEEEATQEGLLAGMSEIAQFAESEPVPAYVLTVNDLMLDSMRTALKKLRKREAGNAARYKNYMFSVLKGIKMVTEGSAEAGVASGLAVDIRDYFDDDRRYKAWKTVLGHFARAGEHQDVAEAFLLFMRNVKERRPLGLSEQPTTLVERTTVLSADSGPDVPEVLSERTLPAVQQAAAEEAKDLCALVRAGRSPDKTCAWQFEFVQRQQQMHLRDTAQRMLSVFLNCERKALAKITKIKMLPCRTWEHVLYMLGAESGPELAKRIEERLLTIQEIVILEKAFLQTFAKRKSLERVYGRGDAAGLMIDSHLPEIRQQSLAVLRRLHQTEPKRFGRATEELNDEETPQNSAVKRLIDHYIRHAHTPPA